MLEILPAILARDESEFRAKLEKLRPLGLTLHLDVMDGTLVPEKTWAPVDACREFIDGHPFEVHLMVAEPESQVSTWLACGARAVMFHAEATPRHAMICRGAGERCKDVGIAVNPETDVATILPALQEIEQVMVMGVTPGRSGQSFQTGVLQKIRAIRAAKPTVRIVVDGGVKPENVRAIADAGADAVIAGSAITDQDDPAVALASFQSALGQK